MSARPASARPSARRPGSLPRRFTGCAAPIRTGASSRSSVRNGGAAPETYARLRPRLVETLLGAGAEIGLHGSYTAATDPHRLAAEKAALEAEAGPVRGQRYHYLRVD